MRFESRTWFLLSLLLFAGAIYFCLDRMSRGSLGIRIDGLRSNELRMELLGYDMSKGESALVSVTYPDNASAQLKNIPADQPVYKFYFRHIDSGDVFLGTKWDADLTWQQALKNQLKGFKIEFKIE